MRILEIVPTLFSARLFLTELFAELDAQGTDMHLACSTNQVCGQADQSLGAPGTVHSLPFPRGTNPWAHWRTARALDALVNRLQPDFIHAHFSSAIFTTALARKRSWPVTIGTFHGLGFSSRPPRKQRLLRSAVAWAAGRLDFAWVLNDDDFAALTSAAPAATVGRQAGYGVGCRLSQFDRDNFTPADLAATREQLGLTADDFVCAFVGRFSEEKGYDRALRAFLSLADQHPRVHLLLVGAADALHPTGLTPSEQQAMEGCRRIHNLGFRSDVARWLSISDCLLFPSVREGMPVSVMEALAMDVPVITQASRGCRDVVRDNVDGFVLPTGSVEELLSAMRLLVHSPQRRADMAAAARAGRERFDRRRFVQNQRAMYASFAGKPAQTGMVDCILQKATS